MSPEERAGRAVICAAAFAVLMLAAWHVGAGAGQPRPLPAKSWTHGVGFKLRQAEMRR